MILLNLDNVRLFSSIISIILFRFVAIRVERPAEQVFRMVGMERKRNIVCWLSFLVGFILLVWGLKLYGGSLLRDLFVSDH